MEQRRETEGIETLNSLLNQKVNWKSGEFRLPAETDREGGGGGGGREKGVKKSKRVREIEGDKGRRTEEM